MHTTRSLFAVALLALGASVGRGQANAAPAQQGKALPPDYAGNASCQECHAKESAVFAGTIKGRLLVNHPRDSHEALGCESCHGPGKTHAESGGEELGKLVSFGPKSKTSAKERDDQCLSCHLKTALSFAWHSWHAALPA